MRKQNMLKRVELTLIMSLVLFGLLTGLSIAMTPNWKVTVYGAHLRVDSPDTAIAAEHLMTTQEGTYRVKTTHIQLPITDGKTVNAIVREPQGAPSGRPACVFVHGAGTGRAEEVFEDIASAMASAGITTLVQDKRLDNYTSFNRDYVSSARDYEVGLNTLRHWDGVDATKAGVYAESEGTWISMVMAKDDPTIAFEVLTSPPVVSPRSQMAMAATSYMDIAGVPEPLRAIVPKITSMNFGWLGLNYANFNPAPYYSSLTMPLLVNYGTLDPAMPVEQGAKILMDRAAEVNNTNVTVRYYQTNHQMRTGSALSLPGLPLEQHYTHNLEDWVNGVAAGTSTANWATPLIAGEQPFQEYRAPTHLEPALISNLNVVIVDVVLCVLAWLVAALTSLGLVIVNGARAYRLRRTYHLYEEGKWRDANCVPSELHRPLHFSGLTGTLIVTNVITTLIMIACCAGYISTMAQAVLKLNDQHAEFLNAGWIGLRLGAIGSIILLCWMWTRILLNKTRFHFKDDPEHEPRHMMPGHWVVIIATTICVLTMLLFVTFLGFISF